MRISRQISGMIGVYYVAAELSRRGYVALPTIKNIQGPDIIALDQEGEHLTLIQVKNQLTKNKFWYCQRVPKFMEKFDRSFYVFTRYTKEKEKHEYFIVPAKELNAQLDSIGWHDHPKYLNNWKLITG